MTGRRGRRVLAGVAGAALLLGIGMAPTVQMTEAAFTDDDYARTTITAFKVPAPTIIACGVTNNGLGIFQSVRLDWTSPYPATGTRLTLTQGATTAVVPASNITTTGPAAGLYTHSAVLTQALLTSLISNLLGSTTTMTATNLLAGTTWVSAGSSRQLSIALLGLNASCT
ncbi:hypothetical protein [Microbacterium sp. WCS2018Hpa-9]|uniref:hypothetical protein n=1 Tax=Microbacterium sp. WCS2018Hpa-9 TaxID=3073635 RepID=UPI00288B17F3|nr:hypothetical protein [Microbacterium sp. WCS2018Hpa-9]